MAAFAPGICAAGGCRILRGSRVRADRVPGGTVQGYFLLGIWMSLLWAVVFTLSILIRRPIVGYLWSWLSGRDRAWRDVSRAVFAFDVATLGWTLVLLPGSSSKGTSTTPIRRVGWEWPGSGWVGR